MNQDLKVLQLNAENLFIYLNADNTPDLSRIQPHEWDNPLGATVENKDLWKTHSLAKTLLQANADVILLNEVGGLESLENFNRLFLADKYWPFLVEGNSHRGIDNGFLIKKNKDHRFHLFTHKSRQLQFHYPHESEQAKHYMSRDISELHMYRKEESKPLIIFLLVHLKSKLDRDGIDPGGCLRREAELRLLVEVYNEIRSKYSPPVPILVAGDFNGRARKTTPDSEFLPLHQNTDLIDSFDVAGLEDLERCTQLQFTDQWNIKHIQLDYIFLSPELENCVVKEQTKVLEFLDPEGAPIPPPTSLEERLKLPSDHFPIQVVIRFVVCFCCALAQQKHTTNLFLFLSGVFDI